MGVMMVRTYCFHRPCQCEEFFRIPWTSGGLPQKSVPKDPLQTPKTGTNANQILSKAHGKNLIAT